MIEEAYCSFEVAKLLKEKGFPQDYDIYHSMVYNEEDYEDKYEIQRMVLATKIIKKGTLSSYPIGMPEPKCYCPTQQLAMAWLREKYHIHIDIVIEGNGSCIEYVYAIRDFSIIFPTRNFDSIDINFKGRTNSYEEAVETALKYILENLI